MLKDTKSLGNNKAPACESRGFVRKKKRGAHFDTPPLKYNNCMKSIIVDKNTRNRITCLSLYSMNYYVSFF